MYKRQAIILAKEAAVSGGSLNVASGSHLLMRDGKPYGQNLVGAATAGLTVRNTTVNISGTGAVNVEDGLTLNKGGMVNVSGGTLVVNGATTWTPVSVGETSGKLDISGGSVTLQKSSILNADYGLAAQITDKTNQLGLCGTLLLTSADDYTVADLEKAKTTLTGVGTLGFLGGKLVNDAGKAETLVVDASTSGGVITSGTNITSGTDVVGKADGNNLFAENSMNVTLGTNTTAQAQATLNARDINLVTDGTVALTTLAVSTANGNVTVVGDKPGQSLVTGQNGADGAKQDVAVAVSNSGTFNMGLEGNSQSQGGLVDELSVAGGTANVNGNGAGTSDYTINSLSMTNASAQVNATNTTLSIGEWDAQDGTFYVDPAYVSIAGLTGGTLRSALLVGDGSVVNIGGMGGADLSTALAKAGMSVGPNLTLGDGQSALALASPVTVSGAGKIVVDAGVDASGQISGAAVNHQAYFGADSVLVVDASKLAADAAITSGTPTGAVTKTAVIDPDARLQVVNATKGEVTLLHGFTGGISSDELGGTDYGWVNNPVANPDRMLTSTAAVDVPTSSVTLTNTVNKASDVLPGLDGELNPAMADVWDNAKNDVSAEARGVRFLSRAARADYIADARQAAVTIESAARMALVGAVPQMTMAASNAAGNAVTQRTGLAQPGGNAIQSVALDGSMQTGASAGDAAKTGFAMWVMPLYQSSNGFGMKAGNFDMDFSGGLGGVALGADYTFDNAIRAGITFNIGGGYAQGSGDLNETTNNMNFWGIGAYAGWTPGNFGLTADVNYTSTYNKLEQDLPASMQMGKLKSDVTAYAISAGLRGEYKIETSALDIIPHVGVRYMSLNTDEYDVKSGGTLLKGDAINQSIWTFPVGVAFSKQIETGNGWHFKPSLDLAVIPAAGDIDARSDVRFTGTGTKAELDTQTMDYVSYMGQAGLEFGNETTSLGVNYNIQLGAKSTAHGVFGTFRYEF